MDKKLCIFFSLALFWLINISSFGQKIDSICWAKDLRLKWSDFKGKPDTSKVTYMGVGAKAQTHAIISAKGFWEDGLPNYIVSTGLLNLNHGQ